jgi:hypothetical protein
VRLQADEELKKDLSAYISIRLPADPKLQKTVNDDKINNSNQSRKSNQCCDEPKKMILLCWLCCDDNGCHDSLIILRFDF